MIEQREKTHPTTQHSNNGGYQSSWDMDKWGEAPAIKLLAIGRNVANRVTTDAEGNSGQGPHPGFFAVTWQANMWANINRTGHGNEYHCHRGAYWSGVCYVDDGGIDADPALGGELEFMDPRGPIPTMLAPHLRVAMSRSLSSTEKLSPKAGRLVMFPSWVHAPGAPLSRHRRAHLDRLQSHALGGAKKSARLLFRIILNCI